jgi:hypothetical protein
MRGVRDARVGAVSQELLLRDIRGHGRCLEKRSRRLLATSEAGKQVAPHRVEEVVVAQRTGCRDRLEQFKACGRPVHHGDRDRAIQFDDRDGNRCASSA